MPATDQQTIYLAYLCILSNLPICKCFLSSLHLSSIFYSPLCLQPFLTEILKATAQKKRAILEIRKRKHSKMSIT